MITTSIFRWQVWMAAADEFDHIFENSQRVFKLNAQYEYHPYVEHMEFIAGRSFTKQLKQLLQANDKWYKGMELHTRNIRFSPEHRDH